MKKENIGFYVAAIGGAFLLVLVDLFSNLNAATTLKIGGIFEKYVFGRSILGGGLVGLLIVLIISAFFCWLYQPEDKVAAFTRGFTVFAVLNVISPYSVISNEPNTQGFAEQVNQPGANIPSITSSAYAEDNQRGAKCRPGKLKADSTLIAKKYVSSCKPYYSGFLGFGSFFNNTIEYCESGHWVSKGARVKYLQSWETNLRSYRYTEIDYAYDGQICTGWVSDGRKEVRYVIRD